MCSGVWWRVERRVERREVARGGMLRSGLGFRRANVAACLNVAADHLGLKGIDTLEQLAEIKRDIGDLAEAVRLFEEALAIYDRLIASGDDKDPLVLARRADLLARFRLFERADCVFVKWRLQQRCQRRTYDSGVSVVAHRLRRLASGRLQSVALCAPP